MILGCEHNRFSSFLVAHSLTNGQLRKSKFSDPSRSCGRPLSKLLCQLCPKYSVLLQGPGTHIGMLSDYHPPFERGLFSKCLQLDRPAVEAGTVVGIDVDMDDGQRPSGDSRFRGSKPQIQAESCPGLGGRAFCSQGSLAFWANGEFLGIVKDNEAELAGLLPPLLSHAFLELKPFASAARNLAWHA